VKKASGKEFGRPQLDGLIQSNHPPDRFRNWIGRAGVLDFVQ